MTGKVTASAQGTTTALDVLDIISDRTRVELVARSELRLCLHGPRKLVTLKGPLGATIGADGVSADDGKAIALSKQDCAVP